MGLLNRILFNKKKTFLSTNKMEKKECMTTETIFVRGANIFFSNFGIAIARYPWISILISILITLVASSIIPFTEMSNDVSDFTPSEARARKEIMVTKLKKY